MASETLTVDKRVTGDELVGALLHHRKTGGGRLAANLYRRFSKQVDADEGPYEFEFESEEERDAFDEAVRRFISDHPDSSHLTEYIRADD